VRLTNLEEFEKQSLRVRSTGAENRCLGCRRVECRSKENPNE